MFSVFVHEVLLYYSVFFEEVISTLERDLVENIGRDNMILEVNSVK